MPLINGFKYSCGPCIRGHRSTTCNHTDRILIEVRKPGRPLESCGHSLNTCRCGRLNDIFSIEPTSLPQAAAVEQVPSPSMSNTMTSTPTPTPESRFQITENPRARVRGQSRVTKRGSKKAESTTTLPRLERGTSEIQDLTMGLSIQNSTKAESENPKSTASPMFVAQDQNLYHSLPPVAPGLVPGSEAPYQHRQYHGTQDTNTLSTWIPESQGPSSRTGV